MRIAQLLRLRKLHKTKQLLLGVLLVGFVCIIRPDKFLWGNSHVKIQRDDSQEIKHAANARKCSMDHSLGKSDGCEDAPHVHEYDNEIHNINESRRRKDDIIEAATKTNELALDVEAEIKLIVKAYADRSLQMKETKNVANNSALYREIPPVYDDLIKVTMNTRQHCMDASDYTGIIAVHTAPTNFQNRAVFRWLYGDVAKTKPYRFKLIFFIGLVRNGTLQDQLQKENEQHDDMVQGNFFDAYINMTYKAIMVLDYLDNYCKGMHAIFRIDDDVFMNINRVFPRWSYIRRGHSAKTILCYRIKKDRVLRTGKWAVPESLIPNDNYEFMRCPGYFAAFTVDLIHEMNVQSKKVPFFWIDDVVILGLVPNTIGNVFIYPFNKWMATPKHTHEFESCMETLGAQCFLWVGISKIENFKTFYGYISGSIPLVKA